MQHTAVEKALKTFSESGGILRASEAIRLGIHPETLYQMRNEGVIEVISRGIYRIADLPPLENADLVTVALAVPKSVVCMESALDFYGLTTKIPHFVDIACKRGSKRPALKYPPLRVFSCSLKSFEVGIQEHWIDGIKVKIYSPEKTIVDCFKYRKRVGVDTAIEALKIYWSERRGGVDQILECAKACRMMKVMHPYIESVIHE